MGPWSVGGIHLITQGKRVVEFRLIICQNDTRALNKVSTIAVKIIRCVLLFVMHLKMANEGLY